MKRSKAVNLAVVPLLAAAFSACGDTQKAENAYCVDKNDKVVENRDCDGTSNSHFWYYGSGGYIRGSRVPSGGERINSTDFAAVAQRGGFGASSGDTGVGRATGRAVGGGAFHSGGG
jgi:hypothetical protein